MMLVRLFFLSPSGQIHLVFSRLYQSLLLNRLPGAIAPSWRRRSPDPGLRVHAQGQGREQEQEYVTFLTNLVVDLTQNLVDLLSKGDNAAGSTTPRVNLSAIEDCRMERTERRQRLWAVKRV